MDLSELLRATYAMFRPPKARTVSEWADENRVLVSESSSEPGPWRTDRDPLPARDHGRIYTAGHIRDRDYGFRSGGKIGNRTKHDG